MQGDSFHSLHVFHNMQRLKLRVGELYERSGDRLTLTRFRKSSFTVLTAARHAEVESESGCLRVNDYYWTILILSPPDFFYPRPSSWEEDWKAIEEGRSSQGVAEL